MRKSVNLSSYGQADLGISSSTNVIIATFSSNLIVQLIPAENSPYNYWVDVKNSAGNHVTNTTVIITVLYFTSSQIQQA